MDKTELITRLTKYRDRYKKLRTRQQLHKQLIWCEFLTGLEDQEYFSHITCPPTALMIIEAPANDIAMDKIVIGQQPKLKGPSGRETKQSQETADRVGEWQQRLVNKWMQYQPYFLRELVKNMGTWGEAYTRILVNTEALTHPDDFLGVPVQLVVPDAHNIYSSLEMDEGCMPYEVFEEKMVSAGYIRHLAHEWGNDLTILPQIKDEQLVYFVEWTTPEQRAYFAAQDDFSQVDIIPIAQEGEIGKNYLGFVPYVRVFSGRGIWPDDGDPASIVVGLLTNLESIIIREARNETKIDSIVSQWAVPLLEVETSPDYVLKPGIDDKWKPGDMLHAIKGMKAYNIKTPPPLPPSLMQERDRIDRILEWYVPSIIRGVGSSGEPAMSSSNRYNWATLMWEPMRQSAKRAIGKSLELTLRVIDQVIKAPISIDGFSIGPDDIKGYYQANVDIAPGNPDELNRRELMGIQMWDKQSRRRVREKYFGIENATQEEIDFEAERAIDKTPILQEWIAREALRLTGREQELKALEAGQAPPAAEVAPGPGGMPTEGELLPGMGGSPRMGVTGIKPTFESAQIQKLRQIQRAATVE